MNFKITFSTERKPENYSHYTYGDLSVGDVFIIPERSNKLYIKSSFNYYVDLNNGKLYLYTGDGKLPVVIFKGEVEFNLNDFEACSEF